MSLRIRKDGKILCAALNNREKGDIYIDDNLHYHLSVEKRVLVTTAEPEHSCNGGEWWWKDEVPDGIEIPAWRIF